MSAISGYVRASGWPSVVAVHAWAIDSRGDARAGMLASWCAPLERIVCFSVDFARMRCRAPVHEGPRGAVARTALDAMDLRVVASLWVRASCAAGVLEAA